MAEMKIITQKIERIESHDNAERLAIAFTDIFDWPIIVGKNSFKPGDKVVHFPVDCVVDEKIEDILLGGSKIKLSKGRIRAAKIRGVVSYGILCPLSELKKHFSMGSWEGDLMKSLGCRKYEPPVNGSSQGKTGQKTKKRQNRNFDKYFDMNHLQNRKGIFDDDDIVSITEKLHGTSFRAGYVKRDISGFFAQIFHKIRKVFDKNADSEFVYGSRNVQLQNNKYDRSLYKQMVGKYNLKSLPKDVVVYGEIVGPGIQKNYQYTEFPELFIYDVKNPDYMNTLEKLTFIKRRRYKSVPMLDDNIPWKYIKDSLHEYFNFGSQLDPSQKIMEGIVIEKVSEEVCKFGRKKVKVLNPKYLLNKDNTDFH